ncbi:MAG: hypothetical protein KY454_06385 [Actinobacteria bacterium]|nr:hypothetical protein [Actinomycetota bacterium]MBW3650389.1 hypothetical protein [Actinomycetota bacterium]
MVDARREQSYKAGARVARERMAREAPDQAEALAAVEESDIVVVEGCYDHVEVVLAALGLPHQKVDADGLRRLTLRPEQLVVVNCPGQVDARSIVQIREFVAAGGSLFTTDWALRHVIEPAFPGVLAFNDRPTADAVVRIEVLDGDNRFLQGVMDPGDDPQWWLEGSSYPIRILDAEPVKVLITSRQLGEQWGEAPVAVVFSHGQGEVFHMISHYYLQRTELRNARHRSAATAYAAEKGVAAGADLEGLTVGDVESAAGSARLFANIVADKKRRGGTL